MRTGISRKARLLTATALSGACLALCVPANGADWTGAVSSDWFDAGNWSGGVPNGGNPASINTATPNAPVIAAPGAQSSGTGVGGTLSERTIQGGGTLTDPGSAIGPVSGSTGTVTVEGPGSVWNTASSHIGRDGNGTLTIMSGGLVNDTGNSTIIGFRSTATGAATVDGLGSSWTLDGTLAVGFASSGTLTIQNGATVAGDGRGRIGQNLGGIGVVTIDGPGSAWTLQNSLNVGMLGNGSVSVSNGGSLGVTQASSFIGDGAGGIGSLSATGTGTSVNFRDLSVGHEGTGTLTISGGATGSGRWLKIGEDAGSVGTMIVDGTGSSWTGASFTVNRLGDFGTGTLTISNGGAVNLGSILGIASAGSGTLNIGSASTDMAVAPGTLTAPSIQFLSSNGRIVFNHTGTDYEFSTPMSGPGTIDVLAGTTSLTGASTYTGATTVTGGTLAVNTDISTSSGVTVSNGGVLGGNGTVATTTIASGGTLAPGNSIGTITVSGNLTFDPASNYNVEVSPGAADRTNVTGAATLGGTVNAAYAAGGYTAKRYTILNAAGGITGAFDGLNEAGKPDAINTVLTYDANNAYLDLTLQFDMAFGGGLNANQQNVANALTHYFNTAGGIPTVFTTLSANGLSQLSGEAGSAVSQPLIKDADQFINAVFENAFANLGGAAQGGDALGYASETPGLRQAREAYASVFPVKAVQRDQNAAHWSVWGAGYGGNSKVSGDASTGSNTTLSRFYGVVAGASHRLGRDTVVGFTTGGAGTSFAIENGFGGGNADVFHAAMFGKHQFGAAYVAGLAGYGWHGVTTDRSVTVAGADRLQADFDAHSFSGRLETGYRMAAGSLGVTPYVAGQVTAINLPSYDETALSGSGQFALSYASRDAVAARTELGMRFDRQFATNDGNLKLKSRVAWAHDEYSGEGATPTFQTLPGAVFAVEGAEPAEDSVLVSFGSEYAWMSGWSVAANFDGEFSSTTTAYAGTGALRYRW